MATFNKISPGDFVGLRTDSTFRNATIDAINGVESLMKKKNPGEKNYVDPTIVTIKNNTGVDLAAYAPIHLDTPIYNRDSSDFFRKGLSFGVEVNATKPTGTDGELIGITRGAIPAGGIGQATVAGATLMKYTGNSGDYLKATSNNVSTMARGDTGQVKIISTSNGTSAGGDAYVLFQTPGSGGGSCSCDESVFACLDDDLYADDYTTAKIWPDFEDEIEVYASPLMCDEDMIEKCTMVLCHKIDGDWYAILEGGKCNCNCQEYPGEYSVHAWIRVETWEGESGCSGEYWSMPDRIILRARPTNNPPSDPNDTKDKKYLGVVATYNDYASCEAAMNALNKDSAPISQIAPANSEQWIIDVINGGFRETTIPDEATMMTADQIKACKAIATGYCCHITCSDCTTRTCSVNNAPLINGAYHLEMVCWIGITTPQSVLVQRQFDVHRDFFVQQLDGRDCCDGYDSCYGPI